MNIDNKICNSCYTYLNEINEILDSFEEKYLKMQKELLDYKMEKYKQVYVLDYETLYDLRSDINRKMFVLSSDLRNIFDNETKN